MRWIAIAALLAACGSKEKTSGSGSASASGTAAASASAAASAPGPGTGKGTGKGTGEGTGKGTADAPDPHPAPKAALDKLAAFGAPHGKTIYVPPNGKEPEHWVAFVGGDAAMSAWMLSADPAHLVTQITEWPSGLSVDGAMVEATDRGLPTSAHATVVWILATSRAGLGQPAGLHAVVRVELEGIGFGNMVSNSEGLLVPLASVTKVDELAGKIDPVSIEINRTMKLQSDEDAEKLAAMLEKPDAAQLAAMIPPKGIGVHTVWQGLFVKDTARVNDAAELSALVAGRSWHCDYVSCQGGNTVVTLGSDQKQIVIRDVLVPPDEPKPSADARKALAPSSSTTATQETLRALGRADAKVLAEVKVPRGTFGVYIAEDSGTILRDGDVVRIGSARIEEETTPDQLRFADTDGDGVPEVAIAPKSEDGSTKYVFLSLGGYHDTYAGLAAIGAKDLDDAVARAVAPTKPVTTEQACKLLKSIKSSGALKKMKARVLSFEEPEQPEIGYTELTSDTVKYLRESVGDCALVCDDTRPACTLPVQGPDTEFFLFRWNGDKLELAIATVYLGA